MLTTPVLHRSIVFDVYANYSDSKLYDERNFLTDNVQKSKETIFMRMLQELQISQIDLELKNRELRSLNIELQNMRVLHEDLYENTPLAYFTLDSHGVILESNRAGANMLGVDRDGLRGKSFIPYINRLERGNFLAYVRDCVLGWAKNFIEFELTLESGKSIRVQMVNSIRHSVRDNADACRIAFVEVTNQRMAELKLRLTSKVLDNIQESIMLTDANQRIVAVNPQFLSTTGYSSSEIIGFTPSKLKSGVHDKEFYREMYASLNIKDSWQGEIWNRRKNGEVYPEWANIQVIRKSNGAVDCYIGIFSDISNQEAMKQRLKELAYYDELTGLANRSLLYDRLQLALVQGKRSKLSLAVLFIDLDHFKEINDTYGHNVGDEVLKQAAARLAYCMREGDTLSRLGGDEFVAILPEIPDVEVSSQIAERMVAALEKAFVLNDMELRVTTSIGISVFPQDGDEVTVLLKNADTAMYLAKKLGRSNYQYFKSNNESTKDINKSV